MSSRDADRNLLFGITALQNDFITRDALIAAMSAWAVEKHRSLGEILVEAKALDPGDRDWLEGMFARRLAKHDNDPIASLAAISSVGSFADEIRRSIADPDVLRSVNHFPSTLETVDPYATGAGTPREPQPNKVRFRKLREHASGNLGVVYVARDEELNREVALKEIKPKNADHIQSQAKFLLEAEVTGGLEHPGIVPVYGLGHHDDGRPYYAMRFIRGKSLLDAIKRFHSDESLKRDPGRRLLELQKLLRRFTDVCNAIAYAHSRGILHRDLKPDNVMVGKYGETLVVDWGLAKTLGRSGNPDETLEDPDDHLPEASLQPASADHIQATQAGELVGTPAYMSPEQAEGRLDLLGPASDIYGLGATLYHLIVGHPPVEGVTLGDVLANIKAGQIIRPRTVAPWIDPALEAICLKALALKPESRYPTPKTLAEDLDRWIAGESVTSYPEPFTRRARRWANKHRTSLATATSATAVAGLLLGTLAWVRASERLRIDDATRTTLAQADGLAVEARVSGEVAKWDKAVDTVLRAQAQFESGHGSPSLRLEISSRLVDFRAEHARCQEILAGSEKNSQVVVALEEARILSSNVKNGEFDFELAEEAYTLAFFAYGIDLRTVPVEDVAKKIRLSKVVDDLIAALDDWAAHTKTSVLAERLVAIARAADYNPLRAAIRDAVSSKKVSALSRMCATPEDRRKLGPQLRAVFTSLIILDPESNFPLLETIRKEHPADFWFNEDLGVTYLDSKPPRLDEAVLCLSIAVALKPDSPGAHVNLSNALFDQGKHEQAIEECRQAIRIKPDYADAYINLGRVLSAQGKHEEAIEASRQSIRIQPGIALAHNNLGSDLLAQGKLDEALEEYREAVRIKSGYAMAHSNLGNALRIQGKIEQAVEECREALRIKPDDALAHNNLGNALDNQGKLEQAIEEYQQAIRIKPDLAEAHYNLGIDLKSQGKLEQAIEEYRQAIRIKPDYAMAHGNLGNALYAQGKLDQAIEEYHQTIRSKPDLAMPHSSLGNALYAQGKLEPAIEEYRQAILMQPSLADAHYGLGTALYVQGKLEQAIEEYRQAIRTKPDLAEAHYGLGSVLFAQGKLEQAIEEYRQAIRIKPDYAEAHCDLGLVFQSKGRFPEALKSLERGHELGSRRPGWRFPSEAWVFDARRLVELEAKVSAILNGEATPKDMEERLALADVCYKKGRHATAARFAEEAFAGQPELVDDLTKGHRYNAACAASLAGSGSGKDEPPLDEAARVNLREKALGWLKADLAAWGKVLDGGNEPARMQAAAGTLTHWKEDSDLAGIRDEAALAKLSEGEREAFRALWVDVEALRKKAGGN